MNTHSTPPPASGKAPSGAQEAAQAQMCDCGNPGGWYNIAAGVRIIACPSCFSRAKAASKDVTPERLQKASHGEQILAATHGHEPDPVTGAYLRSDPSGFSGAAQSDSILGIYSGSTLMFRATLGEILARFREPATGPLAQQIAKEGRE